MMAHPSHLRFSPQYKLSTGKQRWWCMARLFFSTHVTPPSIHLITGHLPPIHSKPIGYRQPLQRLVYPIWRMEKGPKNLKRRRGMIDGWGPPRLSTTRPFGAWLLVSIQSTGTGITRCFLLLKKQCTPLPSQSHVWNLPTSTYFYYLFTKHAKHFYFGKTNMPNNRRMKWSHALSIPILIVCRWHLPRLIWSLSIPHIDRV